MATIKSNTDVLQSRKLAEFLSLGSADMCYIKHTSSDNPNWEFNEDFPPMILGNVPINEITAETLPCWSLAALLSLIPQEIFDGEYIINVTEGIDNKWIITYDHHENRNHSYYSLSIGADNLVDACYEMILKLHELKVL